MNGRLVVTAPMDITRRLHHGRQYAEYTMHIWDIPEIDEVDLAALQHSLTLYSRGGRALPLHTRRVTPDHFELSMVMNDSAWGMNLTYIDRLVNAALRNSRRP